MNLITVLQLMLSTVLAYTMVGLVGNELVRDCLFTQTLDKPISTCLTQIRDMTVEVIMAAILKVLQSKDSLQIDTSLRVDVAAIRSPRVSGRSSIVNIAVDRLKKETVITILKGDLGMCCARAIVVAKALIVNHHQKTSICDGAMATTEEDGRRSS